MKANSSPVWTGGVNRPLISAQNSAPSPLVHTERIRRNVTSAWRSTNNGNHCCQFGCSHTVQQQQKQIMEEIPIFRAPTHHASCVDRGSLNRSPLNASQWWPHHTICALKESYFPTNEKCGSQKPLHQRSDFANCNQPFWVETHTAPNPFVKSCLLLIFGPISTWFLF